MSDFVTKNNFWKTVDEFIGTLVSSGKMPLSFGHSFTEEFNFYHLEDEPKFLEDEVRGGVFDLKTFYVIGFYGSGNLICLSKSGVFSFNIEHFKLEFFSKDAKSLLFALEAFQRLIDEGVFCLLDGEYCLSFKKENLENFKKIISAEERMFFERIKVLSHG